MNFEFELTPPVVEVRYTGNRLVLMTSKAFDDLMVCYANALREIKDNFDGDILTSDTIEAIMWREANAQYKYYTGNDVY